MTAREKFLLQAKSRIAKYCSLGEKSPHQVSTKLQGYGLTEKELPELIEFLVSEKFLDEERFARAFANDKLKFNSWGKNKISFELKIKHKIASKNIDLALNSLSSELYLDTFQHVAEKKISQLSGVSDIGLLKNKLAQFLIGKGFESWFVFEHINTVMARN